MLPKLTPEIRNQDICVLHQNEVEQIIEWDDPNVTNIRVRFTSVSSKGQTLSTGSEARKQWRNFLMLTK